METREMFLCSLYCLGRLCEVNRTARTTQVQCCENWWKQCSGISKLYVYSFESSPLVPWKNDALATSYFKFPPLFIQRDVFHLLLIHSAMRSPLKSHQCLAR